MNSLFSLIADSKLRWLPEVGLGYLPSSKPEGFAYDFAYYQQYVDRDASPMGTLLTAERIKMVGRYLSSDDGSVVDVGVGGGLFVRARPNTFGYDVNPSAIEMLKREDVWFDLRKERVEAATFWDSLEHIDDPRSLLDNVDRLVFVSTPIYSGQRHVLSSKHYKPNEHVWYFTHAGLQTFMAYMGFEMIESNRVEEALGRESIGSYAFERVR